MQNSRWGLGRAEQRGRMPSLNLLSMLLLMLPRTRLAFWSASAHCLLMCSFSFTSSPRLSGLLSIPSFLSFIYTRSCPDQCIPPCIWPCSTWQHSCELTSQACPHPFGWHLTFWHVNCTTQPGITHKLAESVLDIKLYWSQYGPLRDTTFQWSPCRDWVIAYSPLDTTILPIPDPPNSPSIKFRSYQVREKDVVGNHDQDLTEVHTDDSWAVLLFTDTVIQSQKATIGWLCPWWSCPESPLCPPCAST